MSARVQTAPVGHRPHRRTARDGSTSWVAAGKVLQPGSQVCLQVVTSKTYVAKKNEGRHVPTSTLWVPATVLLAEPTQVDEQAKNLCLVDDGRALVLELAVRGGRVRFALLARNHLCWPHEARKA